MVTDVGCCVPYVLLIMLNVCACVCVCVMCDRVAAPSLLYAHAMYSCVHVCLYVCINLVCVQVYTYLCLDVHTYALPACAFCCSLSVLPEVFVFVLRNKSLPQTTAFPCGLYVAWSPVGLRNLISGTYETNMNKNLIEGVEMI